MIPPETIQVPAQVIQKWQEITDLLAEILHVPAALIMKVEPPNIKVFVSSKSKGNPYERDELACLNTGLYCETVMKTRTSCWCQTLWWIRNGTPIPTSIGNDLVHGPSGDLA